MKVLLIKPPEPSQSVEVVGTRIAIHLGLGYIAANLIKFGIEAEIFDASINNYEENELVGIINKKEFDLLGISIPYQWSLEETVSIVKKLRKIGMNKKIVVGGHPASFFYKELLEEENQIDFISIGEGEYSILELVQCLSANESYENILGLAYRNAGEIHFKGYRPLIENLDELPIPIRENIALLIQSKHGAAIPISGSRGCSWARCTFCDIQSFYHLSEGSQWRGRSPKSIVDEMEQLVKQYNYNIFSFVDDDFFGPKNLRRQRAFDLCDEIESRNLDIRFNVLCNVRDVDEEVFLKLKKAGMYRVFLGVESGVQRTLNTFNKGVTVEMNRKAIKDVQSFDMGCECGSIFVDPYTTIEEIKENVAFWESVNMMSMDQYRDLLIFKGTPLQKKLSGENAILSIKFNYDYSQFIDANVIKLNQIVDEIREVYMYPYLKKLKRTRLKIRTIVTKNNIKNRNVKQILEQIGRLHYRWFNNVFVDVFKNILDRIESFEINDMDTELILEFRNHVKDYEKEYRLIQEKFDAVLKEESLK